MKIVIPTRNRPTSLEGVLAYYSRFYPTADILVADGSERPFQRATKQAVADAGLSVDYQRFDPEMSLFDRLLTVVSNLDDEYISIGADDDYPMPEALERGERKLIANPDAVCAAGHLIHLEVKPNGTGTARLDDVRTIASEGVAQRFIKYGASRFTTYYGVARRDLLIARYQFLKEWTVPGFFDYSVGLMDLSRGHFIGLPQLGTLLTRNANHSYFRPAMSQVYLRRADDLLAFRQRLLDRLAEPDGCDAGQAERIVSKIIDRMVASACAAAPQRLADYTHRYPYTTPFAAQARQQFADLFHAGTEERELYAERLAFIAERLQRTIESSDQGGEGGFYESI